VVEKLLPQGQNYVRSELCMVNIKTTYFSDSLMSKPPILNIKTMYFLEKIVESFSHKSFHEGQNYVLLKVRTTYFALLLKVKTMYFGYLIVEAANFLFAFVTRLFYVADKERILILRLICLRSQPRRAWHNSNRFSAAPRLRIEGFYFGNVLY
jgi:hypothetical protein